MILNRVQVINVGPDLITRAVPAADRLQLDWRPPAFGDAAAAEWMNRLTAPETDQANAEAIGRVQATQPRWVGVRPAGEVIGFLDGRAMLHAGPPITWERMCAPVQGALIGACLYEGWASTAEEARTLLASGAIALAPCHEHRAVGPMAGVVSPTMPVMVVTDADHPDRRAFATLNEGLGKVLRFGAYDTSVLDRLAWLRDTAGPILDAAVTAIGGIDTPGLFAQALSMGDEGHNRNVAATALLARRLAPVLAGLDARADAQAMLAFLAANDHFALNLSMAGAKLSMDAGAGVPGSTLVTAMARNGVEFGLRVSGTGGRWFTATVGPADGLFFPGYGPADANPDLGDSAITETLGLGGFAMAASPAITAFVGGTPADALAASRSMRRITLAAHPAFPLPALGFQGTPSGIDVLQVLRTGVLPVINTGIAHREAGIGQIGAGVVTAPAEVFLAAVRGLAEVAAS
ncbi:MAG: DUF1116 domain-containing protein [Propioniciclava sp.]